METYYDYNLSTQERKQLNVLSKEAFGVSSKWQTKMKRGKLEERTVQNSSGESQKVKVLVQVSLEEVTKEMNIIIEERKLKNKASEEAKGEIK
jgi:hypothetical protein